jgi:ubiquinone/menaquinone biosynthesis C-methylase UbiE
MKQKHIWDYFQGEGKSAFDGSYPRLNYLIEQLSDKENRILNIGVGIGIFEKMAIKAGKEIYSLDPSDISINRLSKELNMTDRAKVGYSQKIPFPKNYFDAVVMSEVLEHLNSKTLTQTINQVHRVLKPGGLFLGTVPARENLNDSKVICPNCAQNFHRWGHLQSFDNMSITNILNVKFRILSVGEIFFIDWYKASLWKKTQGIVKKFLSWKRIGTYGNARNIFFKCVKN